MNPLWNYLTLHALLMTFCLYGVKRTTLDKPRDPKPNQFFGHMFSTYHHRYTKDLAGTYVTVGFALGVGLEVLLGLSGFVPAIVDFVQPASVKTGAFMGALLAAPAALVFGIARALVELEEAKGSVKYIEDAIARNPNEKFRHTSPDVMRRQGRRHATGILCELLAAICAWGGIWGAGIVWGLGKFSAA